MSEENIKIKVLIFTVGVVLGISTTVLAATAYSPYGYYGPHLGYSYQNQAWVSNDTRVYAATKVENQEEGNVPTGYMGVRARLFKDDELYKSTTMRYSTGPCWGMGTSTSEGYDAPSGTYYSKGITAAYHGDGYYNYYTFQSPSINH